MPRDSNPKNMEWGDATTLADGADLASVRKSGGYIVTNPANGPAEAGTYFVSVINGVASDGNRSSQHTYMNTTTGAMEQRVYSDDAGGWTSTAAIGGGGGGGGSSAVSNKIITLPYDMLVAGGDSTWEYVHTHPDATDTNYDGVMSGGLIYAHPIILPRSVAHAHSLSINVRLNDSPNEFIMGLYNSDPATNLPSTLVAAHATTEGIAATIGKKSLLPPVSTPLDAGVYWAALQTDGGNVSTKGCKVGSAAATGHGGSMAFDRASDGTLSYLTDFYMDYTYADFPADLTGSAWIIWSSGTEVDNLMRLSVR